MRQSSDLLLKRLIIFAGAVSFFACSSSTPTTPTPVTRATFVMTWGTLAFGTTGVGRTASTTAVIALVNTGAAAVPVTSVTDDNAGEFPWTTTCQLGASIATGSSCTVTARFTPNAVGARTATLTIAANSTTQALSLTGTGATVNPQLTISGAGDAAPTVFLLSVTGATPGGPLTLHTIYKPSPGNPGAAFPDASWMADASGNLTANVTTDSPGTYEHWLVDLTSGLSTNHVFHTVP